MTITDLVRELISSEAANDFNNSLSGFDLIEKIQNNSITPAEANDQLLKMTNYFKAYQDMAIESGINTKCGFNPEEHIKTVEKLRQDEEYPVHLACSLLRHDFVGFYGLIHLRQNLLDELISRENVDLKHHLLRYEVLSSCYEQLRIGLSLVPYLAFGDSSKLIKLTNDQFLEVLKTEIRNEDKQFVTIGANSVVTADSHWITYQIMKNARKHTLGFLEKKGWINVEYKEDSNYLICEVTDNGPGIRKDVLPKIFNAYTKNGTGIGLQMVKRLVELRKGYIEVISRDPNPSTLSRICRLSNVFRYNTKDNEIKKIRECIDYSTKFTVYLSKN